MFKGYPKVNAYYGHDNIDSVLFFSSDYTGRIWYLSYKYQNDKNNDSQRVTGN